jgi:4-diphosphocytidyl-2-C-methyl-D-erythritol kinase
MAGLEHARPTTMVREAPAKLNLWLRVTGRRPDGYHLLDSLVAFLDLADRIEIAPSDRLDLVSDGPFAVQLAGETDNLVLRAVRLLAERAGREPHAAIRLTKNIPVAAGLGGGSADAAAAIVGLAGLWNLSMTADELHEIAGMLGADVPMCLAARPALVSGVGGQLAPAPALPACGVLLVNPGHMLATADVFRALRWTPATASPPQPWPSRLDLAALAAAVATRGNDLTGAAIALVPEIAAVLAALRATAGVRVAAMSGSGATCFALCDTPAEARRIATTLAGGHPRWWFRGCALQAG